METMETMDSKPKADPQLNEGEESAFSKASRYKKYLATFAIFYCNFAGGLGFNYLGATIVDFSHKFNTDLSNVSVVFSIITGSYLAGALVGGVISNLANRQTVALSGIALGSTAVFLFPHVTSMGVFFVLGSMLGLSVGSYDIVQVAWIIDIWRQEAPPYILAQNFIYSLGSIIPPLILSPFLKDDPDEDDDLSTTTPFPGSSTSSDPVESSDLWIPFSIGGALMALGLVVQLVFYLVFRKAIKSHQKEVKEKGREIQIKKETENEGQNEEGNSKSKFEFPPKEKIILVVLSCCCVASYQGSEMMTMQFLSTFAQFSEVSFSEAKGADLLFALSITYCACRGIGILVVLKAPPHFILFGNIALLLAGNILFLFAGNSNTLMWVAACVMGAGLSTTFPAFFAYIERYLFLTDTIVSIILICGGGVSAIYPIIVGGAVDGNPKIMVYVNLFSLTVFGVGFVLTFFRTYMKAKGQNETNLSEKPL